MELKNTLESIQGNNEVHRKENTDIHGCESITCWTSDAIFLCSSSILFCTSLSWSLEASNSCSFTLISFSYLEASLARSVFSCFRLLIFFVHFLKHLLQHRYLNLQRIILLHSCPQSVTQIGHWGRRLNIPTLRLICRHNVSLLANMSWSLGVSILLATPRAIARLLITESFTVIGPNDVRKVGYQTGATSVACPERQMFKSNEGWDEAIC